MKLSAIIFTCVCVGSVQLCAMEQLSQNIPNASDKADMITLENAFTKIRNTIVPQYVTGFDEDLKKAIAENLENSIMTLADIETLTISKKVLKDIVKTELSNFGDSHELSTLFEHVFNHNDDKQQSKKDELKNIDLVQQLITSYCKTKNPATLQEIQNNLEVLFVPNSDSLAEQNQIIQRIKQENEERVCDTLDTILHQRIAKTQGAKCVTCGSNNDKKLTYWSYDCFTHVICTECKTHFKQNDVPSENPQQQLIKSLIKLVSQDQRSESVNNYLKKFISSLDIPDFKQALLSLDTKTIRNLKIDEKLIFEALGPDKKKQFFNLMVEKINNDMQKNDDEECPVCFASYQESQDDKPFTIASLQCLHPICKKCISHPQLTKCPICNVAYSHAQ